MNRRRLLLMAAGLAVLPGAALAAPMVSPGARLRLVDAHSGAVFDGPYRNSKGRIADALCFFLRDRHTGGMTNIDLGVLDFLAAVMAATGQSSATVLSAYRSLLSNARLATTTFGVADNSQHLYGRALDVSFPDRLEEAMAAARELKRGGVGWYPRSQFIHLDSGPVRNWELGVEGLREELLQGPAHTRVAARTNPKTKGVTLAEGPARMIVGGGRPPVVLPGRTLALKNGQVAGLLKP